MITTVTMNASLDKAYFMDEKIENGTVMRVRESRTSAGGKGVNVARVIKICGQEVQATGLVGGFNGKQLEALIEQDEISHVFIHVDGETRCCINILDSEYGSTEYLEPGFRISEKEEQEFLEKFPEIIKNSSVVTISGSIPRGLPNDIYAKLITIAKSNGKTVILDSSGETLKVGLKAHPDMIKPNQDEIEQLFQTKIQTQEEVIQYAKKLQQEYEIPYVVVSLGKAGSLLVRKEKVYLAKVPKLEVVNTVGCGDSMVGGFAVAFERGYEAKEALRYASAVASANALSSDTGKFKPEQCEEILNQIEIEEN